MASRWPSTWRSVSRTNPRLSRSPTAAASAPIAKRAGIPERIEHAGARAELVQALPRTRRGGRLPPRRPAAGNPGLRRRAPAGPGRGRAPGRRSRRHGSRASGRRRGGVRLRTVRAGGGRSGSGARGLGRRKQGPQGVVGRPEQGRPGRDAGAMVHYIGPDGAAAGRGRSAGIARRHAVLQSGRGFEYTSAPFSRTASRRQPSDLRGRAWHAVEFKP